MLKKRRARRFFQGVALFQWGSCGFFKDHLFRTIYPRKVDKLRADNVARSSLAWGSESAWTSGAPSRLGAQSSELSSEIQISDVHASVL